MEKIFPEEFSFIMRKNMVEKNLFKDELDDYKTSGISDQYLIEKTSNHTANDGQDRNIESDKIDAINHVLRDKITRQLQNEIPFAVPVELVNENFIVTLIPIFNPENVLIAYIISYAKDNSIKEYQKGYYGKLLPVSLIYLIIISFIYYINYSNKKMKRSRDFLQSITDNMIAGLIVIDTDHKVVSVNPAAEKMLGYYLHELKGRNFSNIMYYKDENGNIMSSDKWPIFDNLNFGLTYRGDEGFYITRKDKEIPIEITATTQYKDISIVGYIIVFRPVSQEKET
jgi:PAS domain S-box-containing protein